MEQNKNYSWVPLPLVLLGLIALVIIANRQTNKKVVEPTEPTEETTPPTPTISTISTINTTQGGTIDLGNYQYVITEGDFTHLNDLTWGWSYGNPCGVEFFTEGIVYGDLILSGDCFIRYGKLTVYGEVIYNGYTIDTSECTESDLVIEGTLTLNNENSEIFSYYPNPVNNIINIKGDNLKFLDVYDATAKKLFRYKLHPQSNIVNLNTLSAGMYFFTVTDDNGGSETKKIIKK